MKLKRILPGFALLFALSFVITSCLNDDNLIPPNCNDGILNNGEFDVDCGGNCPNDCPPSCVNGVWDPDFGELDVDCGGPNCDACPTCNDEIMNGDEIGIDCGGTECEPCSTGGSCINGVLDGAETGVDCGGPDCPPCPVATCDDGIMNGDEEGVDCGGANCPICGEPSCDDQVLNGFETGIDCGDPTEICPPCQVANQGQIIFRINNGDFNVFGGSTALLDTLTNFPSKDLRISGTAGSKSILLKIPNAQTIAPGQTVSFDPATFAAGYIASLEFGEFGDFSSGSGSSSLNVTFDAIDLDNQGTALVGRIEGILYNFSESYNVVFSEGTFNLVTVYAN